MHDDVWLWRGLFLLIGPPAELRQRPCLSSGVGRERPWRCLPQSFTYCIGCKRLWHTSSSQSSPGYRDISSLVISVAKRSHPLAIRALCRSSHSTCRGQASLTFEAYRGSQDVQCCAGQNAASALQVAELVVGGLFPTVFGSHPDCRASPVQLCCSVQSTLLLQCYTLAVRCAGYEHHTI